MTMKSDNPSLSNTTSDSNILDEKLAKLVNNEADFRGEIIYFIIVDRFCEVANDITSANGLSDDNPTSELSDKSCLNWGKYWGGNLDGIISKIPYLKQLGVTAIWLSPLFEQVDDMQFDRGPMHGYWTKDFRRINPRFIRQEDNNVPGSSETLKDLVDILHLNGMKLVLDVVCNHSSPDINGVKGLLYDDGQLIADFYNDKNDFYYHYPEISDWDDEFQLIHGEISGLATFKETNINYRNFIKTAIKSWLDAGIDALRIDTVKHMPIWFWQEFTSDMKSYRPDLFMFGEYGYSNPWDSRTVTYANNSGMSILDFGLCDAIRYSFSGKEPGGFHLVHDLLVKDHVYQRANELVTFIDNHDMPRFLSICPDARSLEIATTLLFCLRGIPTIFYGTEQYLVNNTEEGEDPYNRPMMESFDTQSNIFKIIKLLSEQRHTNSAFNFGSYQQRYISDDVYVFERRYRDSWILCILNKGQPFDLSVENLSMPSRQHTCLITGRTFDVLDGHLSHLHLEAQDIYLAAHSGPAVSGKVVVVFQLNGVSTAPGESLALTGDCQELGNWDLTSSYGLEYVNRNTWIAEVPFDGSAGNVVHCKFVIVCSDGRFRYENLTSRCLLLPAVGRLKHDCIWGSN